MSNQHAKSEKVKNKPMKLAQAHDSAQDTAHATAQSDVAPAPDASSYEGGRLEAVNTVEVVAPKAPELTAAEKRALLNEVFATEQGIRDAEAAVNAARVIRSAKVRELIAAMGTGPWKVDGVKLSARTRGPDAFLVRPGEGEVESL